MNLFDSIVEAIEIAPDVDEQVKALCDFILSLDEKQLKHLEIAMKEIDFEARQEALYAMQAFAYEKNLKDDWWRVVDLVKESKRDCFWHVGWDAAFDNAVAILLKPYFGKAISHSYYELITSPLQRLRN